MTTQHCDRVMQDNGKKWSVSAVVVQLTSEEVTLSVADGVGWNIIFDTEPTKVSPVYTHNAEVKTTTTTTKQNKNKNKTKTSGCGDNIWSLNERLV